MNFDLPPGAGVVSAPAFVDAAAVSTLLASASGLLDAGSTAIVVDAAAMTAVGPGGQAGLAWLAASVQGRPATAHLYNVSAAMAIVLGDSINAFDSARVS